MSTEERKIQLSVEVDATGAQAGFTKVETGADKMAQTVSQAGAKAGAGMDKLGDAGAGAATKLDSSTKGIIASIQRTTAAMEAGERGSTQYFEALAKQRGVSVDTLRPYLDQLQAARAAQDAANVSLGNMGISAKQTAAALRGVPAQFTDIFTSLQGGQAPLTVLLQQGGQLKDMFGGVGNAARAMGGYVLGLVNPYTVAAAAAGGLYFAYQQGSKEAEAFNKSLILSGNNASVTASGLSDIARSVRDVSSSITQSRAAEFLNGIATSGKVGEENLARFTKAALEFEAAGGGAASEVAKAFADLAKEPLKASISLSESMNYLTRSTYEQIKALEEQGKFIDAARVAQEAYATALEQRTPALVKNLGYLETSWKKISSEAKRAWDSMLDVGRAETGEQRLAAARENLEKMRTRGGGFGQSATERRAMIQAAQDEVTYLERVLQATKDGARSQQEFNERTKAGIALSEQAAAADGNLSQQRRKVAEATALFSAATKGMATDSAEYRQAEADYLKTVSAIAKAEQDKTTARVAGGKKLTDAERERLAFVKQNRELQTAAVNEYLKGLQDQQKMLDQTIAAEAKRYAARESDIERIRAQVQAETEAAAAIGLSKPQLLELAAVKLEDAAASKERLAIDAEIIGDSPRIIQSYRDEAQALRDLAKAKRDTGAKQARQDASDEYAQEAKRAEQEWIRASQEIERALTDSLMRGFESGKGFAENLRDTVVNMFKTMVLRPVISAIVNPVAGAITGSLGLAGTANAATSASSLLNVGSALGGFGTAAGYGAQALFAGNGLGALSGGMSMIGAGSFAQGAGMVAGVLGPVVAGVTSLSSLIKSTKTPGEQAMGGYYSSRGLDATLANAMAITPSDAAARDLVNREDAGLKTFAQQTVDGVLAAATSSAKALGLDIALGIDAGFAANLNGKGKNKNAFGYAQIFADGELAGEYSNRELGEDRVAAGAKFAKDLSDAVADVVLAGTDFKRTGETSAQTLARLGGSLTAVNASFDLLGVEMLETSLKGGDMASALADVFGGVEQFQQATATFYSQFYSDSEKFATQQRLLRQGFDELGIAMPRSTRDFRALVEAQDLTTEAGRDMYAQLMALAPTFSEVSKAVEGAFDSISRTTASSVRDIQLSLLDDKGKYQFLDAEIESLITKLSEATLPSEIERLFGQINANTTQAYGLLDPSQQKNAAADFIDALYEAEAIAQSRLSVTGQQATAIDRQVEAVQVHMEAAKLQREAADTMASAATEMRLAAERMMAAANTPSTVQGTTARTSREVAYA